METSGNLRRMSLGRVEKVVCKVLNIHSARETSGEVLRLLADGLTKAAVAEKAGIGGSVGVSDCQVGQRIVGKFERLKNRLFHFFVKRELFCNFLCLIE